MKRLLLLAVIALSGCAHAPESSRPDWGYQSEADVQQSVNVIEAVRAQIQAGR